MLARRPAVTALAVASMLSAFALPAAAEPPDPCVLVTKADAAKALGAAITSVRSMTAGPSRSCAFRAAKPLQSVVVTAFRYDSPGQAHVRFIDIVKQTANAASAPVTKLRGVGDEAVSINSSVYVRKGTAALVFSIYGARGAAITARAVTLAKQTLARVH